jgi:DNA-binding NarL/FixJ family response regulator
MAREASPLLVIEETEKRHPVPECPASGSQEQRKRVIEDSNCGHVVIQLSSEDLSRLMALSNRTAIPLSMLSRALLKQAISRYSVADGLDDLFLQPDGAPPATSLNNREADILNLIAQGLSNRAIAAALGLSEQTVKNHVTSILRKMKASNRTQAASLVFQNNVVHAEVPAEKRPAETSVPRRRHSDGVEAGRNSDKACGH